MKQANELSWSQVVMAANAPMMTKAALVDGPDRRRGAAHRAGGRMRSTSCRRWPSSSVALVEEAGRTLDRLGSSTA